MNYGIPIDKKQFLLRDLLVSKIDVKKVSLEEWNSVLHQGRTAGLLGRLYARLKENRDLVSVPAEVFRHLLSAYKLYLAHRQDMLFEVKPLKRALGMANVEPVFLKGMAYMVSASKVADGRLFGDIDILVRAEQLADAEKVLRWNGWLSKEMDDYDDVYYRQWMHEIPPMFHRQRGTNLDVHHNLIPLTSRYHIDTDLFFKELQRVENYEGAVLSPVHQIIHSAVHLLLEGEFDHAFRDLSDIDLLLLNLPADDEAIWHRLIDAAEQLKLGRIIYYALRYSQIVFYTPVPYAILKRADKSAPSVILGWWMDQLFLRALLPMHKECQDRWSPIARWLLYLRSHYLKMPLYILIPHMLKKTIKQHFFNKNRA